MKLLKSIILVTFIFFLHLGCDENSNHKSGNSENIQNDFYPKLDALSDSLKKYDRWMGSILIMKNGELLNEKYLGFRSIDSNGTEIPNDTETRYRIGSVTKTFTAVIIMQLVDEGKLSLDDTLSKYYPEIPMSDKITIEHLLGHQSGIHDFINDLDLRPPQTKAITKEEVLQRIILAGRDFEPGTDAAYSNPNYQLLGFIIEKVTGNSYESEINKRIIEPLGLKKTVFGAPINTKNDYAQSYSKYGINWEQEPETHMSVPHAAGGLTATSHDLLEMVSALFNYQLIDSNSLSRMMTFRGSYGLGIFENDLPDGKKIYSHSGGIDQFFAKYAYIPDQNVIIVSNSNGYNIHPDILYLAAVHYLTGKPYKFPEFRSLKLNSIQIDKIIGMYRNENRDLSLNISHEKGSFMAKLTGQKKVALAVKNESTLTLDLYDAILEFKELENDKFQILNLIQGDPLIFKRVKQN